MDILAFAPHPDDAELGMGGTLARHAAQGQRVGIVDLTRGELGSNGSPEVRLAEARAAAAALGLAVRINLSLPDGGLAPGGEQLFQTVSAIRRLQPRVVAMPYWEDRHPDHVQASRLVREAVFVAGLVRYETAEPAWRGVEKTVYYFINRETEPSFVIDVTAHYQQKRAAIAAHRSQFDPAAGALATRLNQPGFLGYIEARDAFFGARIGARHGEGFVVTEVLSRPGLLDW